MAEFQSILAVTNDWKGCGNDGWGEKKKKRQTLKYSCSYTCDPAVFSRQHILSPQKMSNLTITGRNHQVPVLPRHQEKTVSNVKNMKANSLTENKGSVYFQLNKTALRFLRGTKLMHNARNPHQNNLSAGCISIKTPDRDTEAAMLPSRPCGLHLGS